MTQAETAAIDQLSGAAGARKGARMEDGRSDRLALLGGGWGLAAAAILVGIRVVAEEAPLTPEIALGNAAFGAVYAAPFILALSARRWHWPAGRVAAWTACALLAAGGARSAFSGISLILLPAAFLLAGAALVEASRVSRQKALMAVLGAVAMTVVGAAAFVALFATEDGRCWLMMQGPGSEIRWLEVPYSTSGSLPAAQMDGEVAGRPEREAIGISCTSDVIAPREALTAIGLLALGGLLIAAVVIDPRSSRRPSQRG